MTYLYRLLLSIAFWFSLFGIQAAAAQQLQGTYTFGNSVESTYINFTEGNRFNYLYSSCTGREKGCGIYTLIGNCLVLTFKDNDELIYPVAWTVIDSSKTQGDSVNWQFSVVNKHGVPIPEELMYTLDEKMASTRTNNEGEATLMMPVCNDTVSAVINTFAPTCPFSRPGNYNYVVKAIVKQKSFDEVLRAGTSFRYYTRNIQHNRFEMRRVWRGAPFEVYRKTARRLED